MSNRTPMDRAANGLEACGKALTGLYNAAAQGLPMAADAGGRALVALEKLADAAERAVVLAERAAEMYLDDPDAHCQRCGQRVDLHDHGRPCPSR